MIGFATEKIGPRIGLNVLGRSEIAKQQGSENLDDGPGDTAGTTPTSFDKALIAQKSLADGMANLRFSLPILQHGVFPIASRTAAKFLYEGPKQQNDGKRRD